MGRTKVTEEEIKRREEKLLKLYRPGMKIFPLSGKVNLSCSHISEFLRAKGFYVGKKHNKKQKIEAVKIQKKVGRPSKIKMMVPHITSEIEIETKSGNKIKMKNFDKKTLQEVLEVVG